MNFSNLTNNASLLFSVLTLAIILAKVIDYLVKKNTRVLSEEEYNKIKNIEINIVDIHDRFDEIPTLTPEQNNMLKDLHDLHSKTDADGIPLHYFPRSFIEAQKEIVDVLSEISSHQEKTTYLLEHLIKKMERLEDRVSGCPRRSNQSDED